MMDPLGWSDDFSIEVEKIDEQHKKLFEIINSLISLVNIGDNDRAKIFAVLKEMSDYSNYHFNFESSFIHQGFYIGKTRHLQEHENYLKRLYAFIIDFESEKDTLLNEVLTFLVAWWTDHVVKIDKTLGKHIIENNLLIE